MLGALSALAGGGGGLAAARGAARAGMAPGGCEAGRGAACARLAPRAARRWRRAPPTPPALPRSLPLAAWGLLGPAPQAWGATGLAGAAAAAAAPGCSSGPGLAALARAYHGGGAGSSGGGHAAVTHATTILAVRKGGEVREGRGAVARARARRPRAAARSRQAAPPAARPRLPATAPAPRGPQVVVMGDGQATQDAFVVKANVTKVRRVGDGVVGGFAGRAADGLSLLERLEAKLEEHPGQVRRVGGGAPEARGVGFRPGCRSTRRRRPVGRRRGAPRCFWRQRRRRHPNSPFPCRARASTPAAARGGGAGQGLAARPRAAQPGGGRGGGGKQAEAEAGARGGCEAPSRVGGALAGPGAGL
jgi:hypothetical protein